MLLRVYPIRQSLGYWPDIYCFLKDTRRYWHSYRVTIGTYNFHWYLYLHHAFTDTYTFVLIYSDHSILLTFLLVNTSFMFAPVFSLSLLAEVSPGYSLTTHPYLTLFSFSYPFVFTMKIILRGWYFISSWRTHFTKFSINKLPNEIRPLYFDWDAIRLDRFRSVKL